MRFLVNGKPYVCKSCGKDDRYDFRVQQSGTGVEILFCECGKYNVLPKGVEAKQDEGEGK